MRWILISSLGAILPPTLIDLLPNHGFTRSFFSDFRQHYTAGAPTDVSDEMRRLLESVFLNPEASLNNEHVERLELAVGLAPEALTYGTVRNLWGAKLFYPYLFHYEDANDVKMGQMRFGQESLTQNQLKSRSASDYAENSILSEDAKKFALAREISMVKTPVFKFTATQGYVILGFASYAVYKLRNFPARKLIKFPLLGGVFGFIAGLHVLLRDAVRNHFAAKADKSACDFGVNFAKGGVEYYEKQLNRHIALRELHPNGKKIYNMKGDFIQGWIRAYRYRPISQRLKCCREKLLEYK